MADNVIKAVVDAIAEQDNEIGGQLITRLREAHEIGRDDASTAAGSPTTLTSPVDVFQASDVGKGLDIIEPLVTAATGDEGSYIVATYVDEKNVTLNKIDGTAASLTTQDPVRWRFTTLKVETTLDFPVRDRNMSLWVGDEPAVVPYCQVDMTPGAQEFLGTGGQRLYLDGVIDGSAPTTLASSVNRFVAGDVGKAVWILPQGTPTGNEGPQLITAYVSATAVTVSPGGLTADEDDVWFAIKDYEDVGYLTPRKLTSASETYALHHAEDSEVIDASGSYSALDRLRRSFLVGYATEEELDWVGRNLGILRVRGLEDEIYRRVIMAIAYVPRGTVYALELLLNALYPGGGYVTETMPYPLPTEEWLIYEDRETYPHNVFIILPVLQDKQNEEGKTFLSPSGNSAVPDVPVDADGYPTLAAANQGMREKATSASTTAVDVLHTPITLVDVLLEDRTQELDMDALPSAESPAWTYQTEGAGTPVEGTVFSVVNLATGVNVLQQVVPGAPALDGGRYNLATVNEIDYPLGSVLDISVWWRITAKTSVGGYPWHLGFYDDALNCQYFLFWDDADVILAQDTEASPYAGPTTPNADLDDGNWHLFRVRREMKEKGGFVRAWVDGQDIWGEISVNAFVATATKAADFGYFDNGNSQSWTVQWDTLNLLVHNARNYYNITRDDGVLVATDNLTSAAGLFVAGDVGKKVWISGYQPSNDVFVNKHDGVWEISVRNSATSVDVVGIKRGPGDIPAGDGSTGVTVSGANGDLQDSPARPGGRNGALITLPSTDPGFFRPEDGPTYLDNASGGYDPVAGGGGDGKTIKITNSVGAVNDGSFEVLEVIDSRTLVVDNAGGFTTEAGLTWEWEPDFDASVGTILWSLIDAASFATKTLTLRDALPAATTDVVVWYTSVLSAQLLRNEFVVNEGSGGAAASIYYPFYVWDIDRGIRTLIESITPAGVIPEYEIPQ